MSNVTFVRNGASVHDEARGVRVGMADTSGVGKVLPDKLGYSLLTGVISG